MLWALALAFLGSLLGSLSGYWLISRYLVKSLLHPEKSEGILKPMSRVFRGDSKKRAPRANTDLIAYQKELQEQGENRG